jgi:hypothetical protein
VKNLDLFYFGEAPVDQFNKKVLLQRKPGFQEKNVWKGLPEPTCRLFYSHAHQNPFPATQRRA